MSGQTVATTRVATPQQVQNTTMQHTFNVPGTLSDVLVGDGEFIFMRHAKFNHQLEQLSDLFPLSDQTGGVRRRAMATSGR